MTIKAQDITVHANGEVVAHHKVIARIQMDSFGRRGLFALDASDPMRRRTAGKALADVTHVYHTAALNDVIAAALTR